MAPSLDDYENRRRCCFRGCYEDRELSPFCAEHWELVPIDLQYRIKWAYDDGDAMDRQAAIRAAVESLRG